MAGCVKMNAALSQTWADVSFRSATPVATVLHVRAACSHVPNVTAAPIHRNLPAIDIAQSVRYDTTRASNANVAELQQCLQKFPSVTGFSLQDASDNGS